MNLSTEEELDEEVEHVSALHHSSSNILL